MPWFFGVLVVAVVALALWLVFRRRQPPEAEDDYTKALELWLAGDLTGARGLFRAAIAKDPQAVDPYLQLGNLLRQTGDPKRAAVLHRGLTVRQDIAPRKRISIALSLAEDLLAMQHWQEAAEVLDSLGAAGAASTRYWRARFAQWVGMENHNAAASTLKSAYHAEKGSQADLFRTEYGFYLADRALIEARAGNGSAARRLLKEIPATGPAAAKSTYVQALLAAQEGDASAAITAAASGLMETPEEMVLFLPTLQEALLQSGHYARSLPILETACQAETSPPELWLSLALLYDKLGRREDAIGLLELKQNDPRLTPNVAAPLLKLLSKDSPDPDFVRVWRTLHQSATAAVSWRCRKCGTRQVDVRWFCPVCHGFDTYRVDRRREVLA
jgi:lipopolysaccharide biosynthesis regulator YciM